MKDFSHLQALFHNYLVQNTFQQEPSELYEPVNYILQLGGKRMRPALALMGYQVFDTQIERALPVAYAVEIFHNFSLVHDDIMDQAPLRRGQPTVHHRYDLNTGILSGDVMLIYAYQFLLKTEPATVHTTLLETFNRVAIEVCEGQQMDMNFERRNDVTMPEYLTMIEFKTAALLGGALALGALAAGAPAEQARLLESFGRNAGIAFQLQDDLLDAFGDPTKVGKKTGGDIVQNKKTCLILKALEIAESDTRQALLQLMTPPQPDEQTKIAGVLNILQNLGVPALIEKMKINYLQKARQDLLAVPGEAAAKEALLQLADTLANRDF